MNLAQQDIQAKARRRPVLVWAVFLFYAYLGVSVVAGYWRGHYVLLSGQQVPLPKPVAERVVRGVLIVLEIVAATVLFRLRSAAVPLFMAAWIARAMLTTHDLTNSFRGRHAVAILTIGLVSIGMHTVLLAYVLHPQRKGLLRAGA